MMRCLVFVYLEQVLLVPALFPGPSLLHAERQKAENACDCA